MTAHQFVLSHIQLMVLAERALEVDKHKCDLIQTYTHVEAARSLQQTR